MEQELQLLVQQDLVVEELEAVQDQLQRQQELQTLAVVAVAVTERVLLEQQVVQEL